MASKIIVKHTDNLFTQTHIYLCNIPITINTLNYVYYIYLKQIGGHTIEYIKTK